jgi:hypothetical protein
MKTTATPLVFVSLYVSLGDADGSIEGYKVMPLTKWEEDVAKFEAHLEAEGISGVYNEGEWGGYEVNLENYEVQPITPTEAAVIKKFMGNSPGDFRLPTDFI